MESLRVYERKEDINESEHDDLWDDKVLVKAYNKSVKEIKQKIAQRIGMCNGNSEQLELEENQSNTDAIPVQLKRSKKSRKYNKWKVGDFCRAIYSVDGLEYEGKIITVISDGTCIVQFYGYGNQEAVKSETLKHSLGKKSRNAQKYAADAEHKSTEGNMSDSMHTEYNNIRVPTIPGLQAIPPPPAFSLSSEFNCDTESDALSAMLMSWYMSGYHTGYYQGLLQGKKLSKNCLNTDK